MILHRKMIEKYIDDGRIKIEPMPEPEAFQPNSVDLRLGYRIAEIRPPGYSGNQDCISGFSGAGQVCSWLNKVYSDYEEGAYHLQAGKFYLASTLESVTAYNGLVQLLHGRSSAGRLGISVHEAAGFGDIGFSGTWTLEIAPKLDVAVYPGQRICQVSFHQVATPGSVEHMYTGEYRAHAGPKLSKGLGLPVLPGDEEEPARYTEEQIRAALIGLFHPNELDAATERIKEYTCNETE